MFWSRRPPLALTRPDFRFGDYEGVFASEGPASHLVIAFTGVGHTAQPLQGYEFSRSLGARPGIDKIFLRDHQRSWYRRPEGRAEVIDHCRRLIRHGRYASVTLLGLSMGAYGALSFAEAIPQARVIALCPPFSLDMPRHGRFLIRHKRWVEANSHFAGTDLRLKGDPGRYLILFGDDEPIDIANLELFQAAGWQGLHVCPGGTHNLAGFLQPQGRLGRLLDRLVAGAPLSAIAAAAGAHPAFDHCHALQLLRARRHLYQGDFPAADTCLRDAEAAAPHSPAVTRLRLLHQSLAHGVDKALALTASLAWPSLTLPLPEVEGELQLESAETRVYHGHPMFGPLVRARLLLPGRPDGARVTLSLSADSPDQLNAGGDPALAAFVPHQNRWRRVAVAAPAGTLSLPLLLRDGAASFLLHRRGFGSSFDESRGEVQFPWAMRLRDIAVAIRAPARQPAPETAPAMAAAAE